MANKHESHKETILDMLREGATQAAVVRHLVEQGLKTTNQELSSWLARRAARIRKNMELIEPSVRSVPSASHQPAPAQVRPQKGGEVNSIDSAGKKNSAKEPARGADIELDELVKSMEAGQSGKSLFGSKKKPRNE